jgi:hypothetical protein
MACGGRLVIMRCKAGYLGANRSKGYNISALTATGRGFSPYLIYDRGDTTAPLDVFLTPDGSNVFVTVWANYVDKFSLPVPWRLDGVTHVQGFSVAAQEASLTSAFFKPDGLKMYVAGFSGNDITEYALTSAWDLSTATHITQKSLQTSAPRFVRISPDGLQMHILHQLAGSGSGYEEARVSQYDLATAWDVSSASHVRNFNFPDGSTGTGYLQPAAFTMKPDGSSMFYGGNFSQNIVEYELSDPWNVSTGTYRRTSSYTGYLSGICFGNDGASCYIGNPIALAVYENNCV